MFKNADFSNFSKQNDKQLIQVNPSDLQNMANFKPIKKTVNIRLDADVIEWLKSAGKGYQTRMNTILRKAMLEGVNKEEIYSNSLAIMGLTVNYNSLDK